MTKRIPGQETALQTTSPTTPRRAKNHSAAAVAKRYNGEMLCQPSSRCCSPRPSRAPLRGRRQWECGKFNLNRNQPRPIRTPRCSRKTLQKTVCVDANFRRCDQSNQQYSITALTDATGTISERYAYDAYGKVTVTDGSGTTLSGSAYENRYTYTGREWGGDLGLYHYRARMYSPDSGRFVSRDPIGYEGSEWNLFEFLRSQALTGTDPRGLSFEAVPELPLSKPPPRSVDPWRKARDCIMQCNSINDTKIRNADGEYQFDLDDCADELWDCIDSDEEYTTCYERHKNCRNEAKNTYSWKIDNANKAWVLCIRTCMAGCPGGVWPAPPKDLTPEEREHAELPPNQW